MTPEQFAYWLHGFFEIAGSNQLSPKQVMMVKEHLDLVFKKVTNSQTETIEEKKEIPIVDPKVLEDILSGWKERPTVLVPPPMLHHGGCCGGTRLC